MNWITSILAKVRALAMLDAFVVFLLIQIQQQLNSHVLEPRNSKDCIQIWCDHLSVDKSMWNTLLITLHAMKTLKLGIMPMSKSIWAMPIRAHWEIKHCQKHNGPEGWVLLTKVTCSGHITRWTHKSWSNFIWGISTKHQLQNLNKTSASRLN